MEPETRCYACYAELGDDAAMVTVTFRKADDRWWRSVCWPVCRSCADEMADVWTFGGAEPARLTVTVEVS